MKKEPRGRKPYSKDASGGKPRSPRTPRTSGNARGTSSRDAGDDKPRASNRGGGNRSSYDDNKRPFTPRGRGNSARGTGKPYGERSTSRGRPDSGDKPYGDRRNSRSREDGGDRPYGERRPSRGRPDGGDKPYGERRPTRSRQDGDKPYGERRMNRSRQDGDDRPRGTRSPRGTGRPGDDARDNRRGPGNRSASGTRGGGRSTAPRGNRFDDSRDERRSPDSRPRGGNRGTDAGSRDSSNQATGRSGKRPRRPEYDQSKMRDLARQKGKTVKGPQKETRLNKYIANGGICSRREADELIANGDVTVNGKKVTEMGFKVQRGDVVKFRGKAISGEAPVYVLLNKPKDFITTTSDPHERRTVMELVSSAAQERLFPVGRLDRNTTGLLLLTNDGQLADKLTHPSNNIKKLYEVSLDKPIEEKDFLKLQEGLKLEDGMAKPDDVAIVGGSDDSVLGLEIHIGRNRIVRRMFEHLGYEVIKLDRVMYAGLTKKDLSRGQWRYLSEKEVVKLKYLL